jgi:hypothetical protein
MNKIIVCQAWLINSATILSQGAPFSCALPVLVSALLGSRYLDIGVTAAF